MNDITWLLIIACITLPALVGCCAITIGYIQDVDKSVRRERDRLKDVLNDLYMGLQEQTRAVDSLRHITADHASSVATSISDLTNNVYDKLYKAQDSLDIVRIYLSKVTFECDNDDTEEGEIHDNEDSCDNPGCVGVVQPDGNDSGREGGGNELSVHGDSNPAVEHPSVETVQTVDVENDGVRVRRAVERMVPDNDSGLPRRTRRNVPRVEKQPGTVDQMSES